MYLRLSVCTMVTVVCWCCCSASEWNDQMLMPIPTNDTKVDFLSVVTQIEVRFAVTNIACQIRNVGRRERQIAIAAQLPENAFVTGLKITVDGVSAFGTVMEKEAADQKYYSAKGTKAKIETESNATDGAYMVKVTAGPNSIVLLNVAYQEILTRVGGAYRHVIDVQSYKNVENNNVTTHVLIHDRVAFKMIHTPKFRHGVHKISNENLLKESQDPNIESRHVKDPSGGLALVRVKKGNVGHANRLVILFDVESGERGGQLEVINGYFVAFFKPAHLETGSKHVVFLLDTSGSMDGQKAKQLTIAMKNVLDELDNKDSFNMVLFNDTVKLWRDDSVIASSQHVQEAFQFIESQVPGGQTDINRALLEGHRLVEQRKRHHEHFTSMLIMLSDGDPTVGVKDWDTLLDKAKNRSAGGQKYAIHGIALGRNALYRKIQQLAAENRGFSRKIYADSDAGLQIEDFYRIVRSPVLKEIKLNYVEPSVSTYALVTPDQDVLSRGNDMMFAGLACPRKNGEPMTLTISGQTQHEHGHIYNITESQNGKLTFPNLDKFGDLLHDVQFVPPAFGFNNVEQKETQERPLLAADTAGGFIERMWAHKTVQMLLAQRQNTHTVQTRALALSLKYGFVTELTTMIVTRASYPIAPTEPPQPVTPPLFPPTCPGQSLSRPCSTQPPHDVFVIVERTNVGDRRLAFIGSLVTKMQRQCDCDGEKGAVRFSVWQVQSNGSLTQRHRLTDDQTDAVTQLQVAKAQRDRGGNTFDLHWGLIGAMHKSRRSGNRAVLVYLISGSSASKLDRRDKDGSLVSSRLFRSADSVIAVAHEIQSIARLNQLTGSCTLVLFDPRVVELINKIVVQC